LRIKEQGTHLTLQEHEDEDLQRILFGPTKFVSFLPTCFEFQENIFFFFDCEEVIRSSSNVSFVRQVVGYSLGGTPGVLTEDMRLPSGFPIKLRALRKQEATSLFQILRSSFLSRYPTLRRLEI